MSWSTFLGFFLYAVNSQWWWLWRQWRVIVFSPNIELTSSECLLINSGLSWWQSPLWYYTTSPCCMPWLYSCEWISNLCLVHWFSVSYFLIHIQPLLYKTSFCTLTSIHFWTCAVCKLQGQLPLTIPFLFLCNFQTHAFSEVIQFLSFVVHHSVWNFYSLMNSFQIVWNHVLYFNIITTLFYHLTHCSTITFLLILLYICKACTVYLVFHLLCMGSYSYYLCCICNIISWALQCWYS